MNVVESLANLLVWLLFVGFLAQLQYASDPPMEYFVFVGYLSMLLLPYGAYIAGKQWYNGPLFLIYGALGIMTLVPGFLSVNRLGIRYEHDTSTPMSDFIAWTVGSLFMAIVCRCMGKAGKDSHQTATTQEDSARWVTYSLIQLPRDD